MLYRITKGRTSKRKLAPTPHLAKTSNKLNFSRMNSCMERVYYYFQELNFPVRLIPFFFSFLLLFGFFKVNTMRGNKVATFRPNFFLFAEKKKWIFFFFSHSSRRFSSTSSLHKFNLFVLSLCQGRGTTFVSTLLLTVP